jgi:hypothetical protein
MAKMIGKVRKMWYGQCRYGCCYMRHSKTGVKREEMALALKDAEEEMAHPPGLCFDPKSGMAGCVECYGGPNDDYEHYDNAELDNVPGVWCNVDRRDEMKEYL